MRMIIKTDHIIEALFTLRDGASGSQREKWGYV